MLTASWERQSIETELHPQNGYYLDGKIRDNFGQIPFLHPNGTRHGTRRLFLPRLKTKLGTFIVRGQAGYVYAREGESTVQPDVPAPAARLPYAVYELDSIGSPANGSVLPQRALVVGSLEYQFPVTKSFSGAIFHDVGDAASNFKHDLKTRYRLGRALVPASCAILPSILPTAITTRKSAGISLGARF